VIGSQLNQDAPQAPFFLRTAHQIAKTGIREKVKRRQSQADPEKNSLPIDGKLP
jgi:hypothetical protein